MAMLRNLMKSPLLRSQTSIIRSLTPKPSIDKPYVAGNSAFKMFRQFSSIEQGSVLPNKAGSTLQQSISRNLAVSLLSSVSKMATTRGRVLPKKKHVRRLKKKMEWLRLLKKKKGFRLLLKSRLLHKVHSSMQDLERTKKFGYKKVCLGRFSAELNRMKRHFFDSVILNIGRRGGTIKT